MPAPLQQHIKLVGGANSVNSTIYTSSLIKIGDNVKITGCGGNDGVYTVTDVVSTLNTGEASGTTFTDNVRSANIADEATTIIMDGANTALVAGLSVSGGTIGSDVYITSVTQTSDPATFEISKELDGVLTGGTTLTFGDQDIYYVLKGKVISALTSGGDPEIRVIGQTGDKLIALGDVDSANGIDIWSNNAVSNYATKNSGWQAAEINPTTRGDNAKYMYLYADGTLRARDVNPENQTRIKWYGYIQRTQFNLGTGLVFAEWQEHRVGLNSPRLAGAFTYSFGTSDGDSHTNSHAGNYYEQHGSDPKRYRGVAIHKQGKVGGTRYDVHVNGNFTVTAELFKFDDNSSVDLTETARVGEVISIKEASGGVGDLGEYPKEFLFCKKGHNSKLGSATYQRAYGGALPDGTAPFDFADNESPIIERGVGWNIGVTAVDGGSWGAGTYEFYQTFVYDNNQESLPVQFGNGLEVIAAFEVELEDNQGFQISVYADLAYNGRITGGRIYAKLKGGEGDLILVQDLDIVKGVRPNLIDNHSMWSYQTGKGYYYISTSAKNKSPNLDTYESINGFSPELAFLGVGGENEGYQAGVIANRRTFIANVKKRAKGGEVEKKGDRIMYSEIGKFDTFLPQNTVDVPITDYGEYTAMEYYADRLLAFKHNLIHVVNIASPSPFSWYLEDTIRHIGVQYPFSVTKTPYGIVWVSDEGCHLYDGSTTRNLLNRKIAISVSAFSGTNINWNTWFRGSALIKDIMIGYDPISNSLVMMRSPNDSSTNSNQAFIYDFDSGGWAYNTGMFTDSAYHTNFITDFNNNLSLGVYDGSSDVEFKKVLPVSLSQTGQEFYTADIDFGAPGLVKKIYKVVVTFISDGAETTPFSYAVDGKQNFSGDGGGTFTGNFADTSGKWDVVTLTPSSTISCQSLQIKFASPSTGVFEINDMSIQYRVISQKEAT